MKFLKILSIVIYLSFITIACGTSGNDENNNLSSQVNINWVDQVKAVMSYSGGLLSGISVKIDFDVTGNSGYVDFTASLMKQLTNPVPLDKETIIFYVEIGHRYTVSVHVIALEKLNCIAFEDENVLLLSSPSSSSEKSFGFNACISAKSIGEINLTQQN